MIKPRILVCSESSKITSGFGVYNKQLLTGLYQSNKYDVAEFASYGLIGDKETHKIPWKYYANAVPANDKRIAQYNSQGDNQFGRWRFDRVLVDFKPHIVIDVRDYWMSSFEKTSAFRKYFHWILMPTIDSSPQKDELLDTYVNANAIFTYSDWGAKVLLEQTNNSIKYIATASPAADTLSFKPISNINHKKEIKSALGIDPDAIVIGSVMRNQKRKLFPELILAFQQLITKLRNEKNPNAEKVFLYLHTSYPDAGWDFAELIANCSVADKILFTYACKQCRYIEASPFACFTRQCNRCSANAAIIPNVANGISDNALGTIMSSFDMYIQYAICEGFGMPQIEAAFCGVPVLTINYSAMEDIINRIGATDINYAYKFKELETGSCRVYPDIDDTVDKLYQFINRPSSMNMSVGNQQRIAANAIYGWDKIVKLWSEYIDSVDISSYELAWQQAPAYRDIPEISISDINKELDIYQNLYRYNNLLNSIGLDIKDHWILKHIYFCEKGYLFDGPHTKDFNIEKFINMLNDRIKYYNIAHKLLTSNLYPEDYIQYANQDI